MLSEGFPPSTHQNGIVDSTTIINLALLIVTGIAAVFTGWQALDARHARDEARKARDEAKEYERRALTASEVSAGAAQRSASALEKEVELQIAQLPTEPWSLVKHERGKYELTNITKLSMYAVDVNDLGGSNDITPYEDGTWDEVGPGESIFFNYERSMVSPAQTTVQVTWGDPATGERFNWRRTVS